MPAPLRFWRTVGSLLCPRCGGSRAFTGWFRMARACSACGLVYEREAGYWIGALYFNYGVTAVLLFLVWVGLDLVAGVEFGRVLCILAGLGLLFPVWFFRYSRMLWMVIDLRMDPPDPLRD